MNIHSKSKKKLGIAILCSTFLVSACAQNAHETKLPADMSNDEISSTILQWWDGDYNNDAQIAHLKEEGAPVWKQGQSEEGQTTGGHLPVSSHYRPINLPAFGGDVLYLEEFTFGDAPYRQRIYTLNKDTENNQVSVKLWYFPDKTTYKGAWKNLDMLSALTPEMMSPLPDNCDLIVSPIEDGRIQMRMPENACKFGESVFDYRVSLGPDDFWFKDRILEASTGNIKMTAGNFTYHKLDKVN